MMGSGFRRSAQQSQQQTHQLKEEEKAKALKVVALKEALADPKTIGGGAGEAKSAIQPSEGDSVMMGSINLDDSGVAGGEGGGEGGTGGAEVAGGGAAAAPPAPVADPAQKRRNRIKNMQKVAHDLSSGGSGASRAAMLDENGFRWL